MKTSYETDGVDWASEQARLSRRIEKTPSLRRMRVAPDWIDDIWLDARALAQKATGLGIGTYRQACPWAMTDALEKDWLPE